MVRLLPPREEKSDCNTDNAERGTASRLALVVYTSEPHKMVRPASVVPVCLNERELMKGSPGALRLLVTTWRPRWREDGDEDQGAVVQRICTGRAQPAMHTPRCMHLSLHRRRHWIIVRSESVGAPGAAFAPVQHQRCSRHSHANSMANKGPTSGLGNRLDGQPATESLAWAGPDV